MKTLDTKTLVALAASSQYSFIVCSYEDAGTFTAGKTLTVTTDDP